MRAVLLVVLSVLFASCEAPATMFTDEAFRTAAPEVVRAWRGLGPWHDARVQDLPPGPSPLRAALASFEGTALVAAAVPSDEAHQLVRDFPKARLVFFGPASLPRDLAVITVPRSMAWALVARKAAGKGAAVAFFPLDARPEEISAFVASWTAAGGGPMTTAVGARADLLMPLPAQVFFWTGAESDALASSLAASVAVHGNPGLVRAPGASGVTWRLKEAGLGEFLWKAVHPTSPGQQFLPLETISTSR